MKMKRIFLTEKQINKIQEGIEYTNSGKTRDNSKKIGFRINSKTDDKSNKDVDTRVFGTKKDILWGDGTDGRKKAFNNRMMQNTGRLTSFNNAIDWVKSGFKYNLVADQHDYDMIMKKLKEFKELYPNDEESVKEEMLKWIYKTIDRYEILQNMYGNKYNRAQYNNSDGEEVIMRYNFAKVPGTSIDVISLFEMNDFNFSDIIKHGKMRQNGGTDKLLNIEKGDRERIAGTRLYKKIDINYDDDLTPDVANNFSLSNSNIEDFDNQENNISHFKKNYQYNDQDYTSVTQFIDKSILTAKRALNEINYTPDVLVSAPSSSKFNHYYCINLSRKLGIEYIPDFFKRNVINVEYCEQTEKDLTKAGATESDKMMIKQLLKRAVLNEIMTFAKKPIIQFINANYEVLSNIASTMHSREKVDMDFLTLLLTKEICETLLNQFKNTQNTMTYKQIVQNFISGILNKKQTDRHKEFILKEIGKRIKNGIGQKKYIALLTEVDNILQQYSHILQEEGMNYNFSDKAFKVTDIEKRFRNCIHNVYVISDKVLNKQNNSLQTKYINSNFLVFDEDINSGATLRLVCDLLKEKIDNEDYKIKCLVNAVSLGGR